MGTAPKIPGGNQRLSFGVASLYFDGSTITTVSRTFTAPKDIKFAPTGTLWRQTDYGAGNVTAAQITGTVSGNKYTLIYKRYRQIGGAQEMHFDVQYWY